MSGQSSREFVHVANLERFRDLLTRTTDEGQRQQIRKLMAEQEAQRRLLGSPHSE